jgi:TatD DNase family protein
MHAALRRAASSPAARVRLALLRSRAVGAMAAPASPPWSFVGERGERERLRLFAQTTWKSTTRSLSFFHPFHSIHPHHRPAHAPKKPKTTDIGANLTDPMFAGLYHGRPQPAHPPDLEGVLGRAWGAGVGRIIITATNLEEGRAALALARTDARLFCTAGVHPTRAGELVEGGAPYLDALRALIAEGVAAGKCVAVGEAGLDNDRLSFCDARTQAAGLSAQLALAAEVDLPLFLHCRAAGRELAAALGGGPPLPRGGVVHSFDGSADELKAFLDARLPGKLFIGLNGCSLKTEENLAVAAAVPLERLLLETDAPWCEPRPSHASAAFLAGHPPNPGAVDKKKWVVDAPVKGRNEPAAVVAVARAVAGARARAKAGGGEPVVVSDADLAALATATTANAEELFGFGA